MQQKDFQILLGKKITSLRKSKKISQVNFAYMLDKEKQNFNKIEKGKSNATIWTLYKIAQLLEVEIEELFKWDK
jgi:DNA-binding XRE family transcriptional regulator